MPCTFAITLATAPTTTLAATLAIIRVRDLPTAATHHTPAFIFRNDILAIMCQVLTLLFCTFKVCLAVV